MGRPRSDIRQRVVRAARGRFTEAGVDGASLRTIARDARTSIGMVFYYFPTKDDLFLAVVEEVYAPLLADLGEILGAGAALRERVRRVSARLGAMSEEELQVVSLVVREALVSSERFGRVVSRFQRGHVPMVLGALAEGIERGEIDGSIPPAILLVSTFAMLGVPQIVRRVGGKRGMPFAAMPSAERTAELATAVLFGGIGAGGAGAVSPRGAGATAKRPRGAGRASRARPSSRRRR